MLRPNSRRFRILQALNQTPQTWYSATNVWRQVDALAVGAKIGLGGLYSVLDELEADGMIDTVTAPIASNKRPRKTYRISDKGRHIFTLPEAAGAFPWTADERVQGHCARYRVRERFLFPGRGLMFVAEVTELLTCEPMPTWFTAGALVMIKTPKPDDGAVAESAWYLKVVNQTLENEWPTLKRLVGVPAVVDTVDWGELDVWVGRPTPRRLPLRFIVQRRLPKDQHLWGYVRDHALTLRQWWDWARALAEGLRTVHSLGTVHRDIRPSNIVITQASDRQQGMPVFVDVGEAIFRKVTRSVISPTAPRGESAMSMPRELFTAPELRGRPIKPTRRGDLYSLGAVLFYMATRKAPDFMISDEEHLKDAVTQSLRFKGSLLYDDFAMADIISQCLCADPELRIQSADELLQHLRMRSTPLTEVQILDSVETARQLISELTDKRDAVFAALAGVELQRVNEMLASMTKNGIMIIEGTRDTIVRRLSNYIAALRGGSRYLARTVPRFWWPGNLGIRSRYFIENIELARRGSLIQRLLVVTADDYADAVVHDIVRAHLEMEADCIALGMSGKVETRYCEISAKERDRVVQTGHQRGIWVTDTSAVSLIPTYDSNGFIRAVTLGRSDRTERANLVEQFDRDFAHARPLCEWALE